MKRDDNSLSYVPLLSLHEYFILSRRAHAFLKRRTGL